jgi:hypothetical protein
VAICSVSQSKRPHTDIVVTRPAVVRCPLPRTLGHHRLSFSETLRRNLVVLELKGTWNDLAHILASCRLTGDPRVLLAELITVDLIGETSAGMTPNSSTIQSTVSLFHINWECRGRHGHVHLSLRAWELNLPCHDPARSRPLSPQASRVRRV